MTTPPLISIHPSNDVMSYASTSLSTKCTTMPKINPKKPRQLPPISKEALIARSSYPIHSSYIVKEKIGQGTWGSVHVAVERASGLERAVKKVPKCFTSELARFRQEIVFLQALDHPNIVRLYETFEDFSNIYLVMEYCRGGELFDRVANALYFSEATAAQLMHQILSSLCYIHSKNISHRDLKPENFLFSLCDVTSPMKLIDFGLAKRFSSRRQLRTKVGTLYYIAPEVLEGAYDEKCDVWSAGVILHLLLSGTPPFNGPTDACIVQQIKNAKLQFLVKIWKKVSQEAKDLVKLLLSKDVALRPSAAEALKHPWFQMFPLSPFKYLCALPRPLSVPARLPAMVTTDTSENEYQSAKIVPTPLTPTCSSTSQLCCDLSVLGIHSALCRESLYGGGGVRVKSEKALQCIKPAHTVQFADAESSASHLGVAMSQIDDTSDSARTPEDNATYTRCPESSTFKKSLCSRMKECTDLSRTLVPKWRRFSMHNQLKRAALRVIAQQLQDGEEAMLPLRMLFLTLDSRNDGILSGDEISEGVANIKRFSRTHRVYHDSEDQASQHSSLTSQQQLSLPHEFSRNAEHEDTLRAKASREGRAELPHAISVGSCMCDQNDESESECSDTATELAQLVTEVALDGSNSLEYSDFIAASMEQKHYMRGGDGILRAAFRVFDRDGDGRINPSELKATLGWAEAYSQETNTYGRRDAEEIQIRNAIDRQMKDILVLWDRDGDGSIGFEDFVQGFQEDDDCGERVSQTPATTHEIKACSSQQNENRSISTTTLCIQSEQDSNESSSHQINDTEEEFDENKNRKTSSHIILGKQNYAIKPVTCPDVTSC